MGEGKARRGVKVWRGILTGPSESSLRSSHWGFTHLEGFWWLDCASLSGTLISGRTGRAPASVGKFVSVCPQIHCFVQQHPVFKRAVCAPRKSRVRSVPQRHGPGSQCPVTCSRCTWASRVQGPAALALWMLWPCLHWERVPRASSH